MNKLRERLNKKGFTLVELIVVIVIILILAAALVPNVMRYIGEARESSFQADAATYLVELQGYEAEMFGKLDRNIKYTDFTDSAPDKDTVGVYTLSGFFGKGKTGTFTATNLKIKETDTAEENDDIVEVTKTPSATKKNLVSIGVCDGAVLWYSYTDGRYWVNWHQKTGWTDVTKCK